MNHVETIDYVTEFLLEQGERSETKKGCCFRDDKGNACAVGILIPDDFYEEEMDTIDKGSSPSVRDLLNAYPELILLWDIKRVEDVDLLESLQAIHDNTEVAFWKHDLENLRDLYV